MDKIVFKHKRLVVENVSPFMMTIIKIWKLRGEVARAHAQRVVSRWAKKIDKEIMKDITDG